MMKVGTMAHAERMNMYGSWTIHEAMAAAAGWYMPSLTSRRIDWR